MTTSHNGWPASKNPAEINVKKFKVPGMDRTILVRKEAAPLFLALMQDYDNTVAEIEGGIFDDWSYAFRPIRGYENSTTVRLSNHASGTAIDINAARFPMNKANMTKKQRAACKKLVEKFQIISWGGDFKRIDEMHFELKEGTTISDCKRVIKELGLTATGQNKPAAPAPALTLKVGSKGPAVKSIQRALQIKVDGIYGPATAAAVKAFEKRRPWLWPADGTCGAKTYAALTKAK